MFALVPTQKLSVMFYIVGIFRTSSPGDSILSPWELLQGGGKLRNFVLFFFFFCMGLFYVWEDVRVWAHWTPSFCMHLRYLGPVSCAFYILSSLRLTVGSGCNLMAVRSQVFFSFLSVLRSHQFMVEGWNRWWQWHPVYWCGRKFSISHPIHLFIYLPVLTIIIRNIALILLITDWILKSNSYSYTH